ncbi:MAG: M3 family oligoendopeptidase [Gemmataceae bacterium]
MSTVKAANRQGSSADGVAWDLSALYAGIDDPRIQQDLDQAHTRARAFEQTYRGQIEVPGGPEVARLAAAVTELESLSEQMDRPIIYAMLVHSARTDDPKHGSLLARTRERRTEINKHLIFFDLEWVKIDDASAKKLLEAPELARYRHFLGQKLVWKPHYLSEPEEKILDEKSVTGRGAFVRLFDETVSSLRFPFTHGGATDEISLQQVLAKLYDADRSVRAAGAAALTEGLKSNARLLGYILNTLVLDHRSDCTLRRHADVMNPRHLANEIDPKVVDALLTAAEQHHATVQRYYRLKGKLLGLDQLCDYDRYAPLFSDQPAVDWPTGRRIVEESYAAFSPQAGDIIRQFFEQKWIDAELRQGKRGGAFASSAVPSAHPFILMSYTDKLRDVMTLAHELGHGLHQYLARGVGYLQCDTPLTTAETASVFGEMLTFRRLQQLYPEPRTRLAMLCSKIEDGFATVFRQVVLTRFEQSVHRARHEEGELSTERLNQLWMQANQPMHGDVVHLTEGYAWWWAYIGHFVHVPFYCYAYAFGELLVLALVKKYEQDGEAFVPRYLGMLAAGGSEAPHVLVGRLGVDVTDPSFWELGLQLLGDMVRDAEQLAASL